MSGTVAANASDGKVQVGPVVGSWAIIRDATSGNASTGAQNDSSAVGTTAVSAKGGGGTQFTVKRAFFEFNFHEVSNAQTAVLKLKNPSGVNGGRIRVVKAGDFYPLSGDDFDNIPGFSAGNTMAGNVTDYVDAPVILTAGQTTTITLNSTAVTDINASDITNKFRIAVVGDTYDYSNVEPSSGDSNLVGIGFADQPGTENDPRIDYTTPAASGRSSQAGGGFGRQELRTKQAVTTEITADTDFEFKFENNLKNQVYFTIEGARNKDIFNTASLRTTTSDSGSNVLDFISEPQHASFILAQESTSSFFMSSSTVIPGNSFNVVATNLQVFSLGDSEASGSTFGVKMGLLS